MIKGHVLLMIIISILLISMMISEENTSGTSPDAASENFDTDTKSVEQARKNDSVNRVAVIETNYGIIKFELYEKRAPITTANFIKLADERFYDGIKFHRIIDDFVIQTGDPNSRDDNPYDDGSGGSDETIPLEIHPELTHIDGAVGMARGADEDSASSQFYICDGEQHGLDGDYAVFGITIEGIEIVREIAQAETYPDYRVALKDHPKDDIVMFRVYIETPINFTDTGLIEDEKPTDTVKSSGLPGFEAPLVFSALLAAVVITAIRKTKNKIRN